MAPAHGFEDYSVFKSMGGFLPSQSEIICHVDGEGNFSNKVQDVVGEELAKELVGKAVLDEGSRHIVQLLGQVGALLKIKRIKHKYPYDWRTKKPVIVTYVILFLFELAFDLLDHRATSQWFADLDTIKEDALSALKDVTFYPSIG